LKTNAVLHLEKSKTDLRFEYVLKNRLGSYGDPEVIEPTSNQVIEELRLGGTLDLANISQNNIESWVLAPRLPSVFNKISRYFLDFLLGIATDRIN
jgi:hypothetical protein